MANCPACQHDFKHLHNGACPRCMVKLERVGYAKNGVKSYEYAVIEDNKEILSRAKAIATEVTSDDVTGVKLSRPGERPEVYLVSVRERKYSVVYKECFSTGWMYCPACAAKMFQNIVIDSGEFKQSHKCQKCHAIVEYQFIKGSIFTTKF